ncbi:hypothetical protein CfE428DRAFT_5111 [Chthoniobacter flavus Ellin428]|uniref:Uncharacterized protein n=1 Tax=Chthoniobacter flavus Ellin428 TaxID=497964 RepID=B4D871_9BACT|nr:hypothetical protein [Chthoniobacter flavus]EDY17425.1 hypothetical protein CfE428DRAFT_5111 [Chthoniobacter flavus Ellin428]
MRSLFLTLGVGLCVLGTMRSNAQQMQQEPTPFTTWLDFHQLADGQRLPGLPIWLASVTGDHTTGTDGKETTTIRLQLRDVGDFDQKRLLRLFFDDHAGASPVVVGLDASGAQKFSRGPLGQGLELPTSETMVFSPAGIATLEIQVPGDGSNLRGAFLATLQAHTMMKALDFAAPGDLIDVFERSSALPLPANDVALFGRVKAKLDEGTVKLSATGEQSVTWEFELVSPPLLTMISFEVSNADEQAPLEVTLNDQPLGPITVSWPDLADPGYLGVVRPLEAGMRFRYAGWLRAQKMIPGALLKAGVNRLVLTLPPDAGPAAVRNLALQLKNNWKNLDYNLSPTSP